MEIAKPVVNLGISQWCTMAEDWEREAPQLMAAVTEALSATPWGGAAEGVAFKSAHFRGDGPNQMRLADLNKWAEPLEPLLTRIMSEDLYALLDAEDVIPIPQRGDVALDRIVEVDISRFDAGDTGEVVLDARWRVYKGDNETLLTSGRSRVTEQGAPPPNYDAIVAAMSRAVGRASEEIAAAIASPPAPPRRARPTS